MKKAILDYFLKYVKIDTMSKEDELTVPSTKKQYDLANVLIEDLKALGLEDVKLHDHCFVTGVLKSNVKDCDLAIGFISHMDTIPGFSGTNVNPLIHNDYNGEVVKLKGIELNPVDFPFLKDLKGKTLITTDGTTVLGADDKAGIADIMGMLTYYTKNKDVPHVTIKVAFTPDEEIGGGIEYFNIKDFACDYAYTVDGGAFNEINYENFNASSATIHVKGLDIHPGSAKNHMINASLVAMEYNSLLPVNARPEFTEGYDGFNHLTEMNGNVGEATLKYILRNHSSDLLKKQKQDLINTAEFINKKYNSNTITLEINDSYYNMADIISKDPRCVIRAKKAIEALGYQAITSPIRGGTDGAKLTQMGLNTPNLGTGGYNCHGPYECACLEEMENVASILVEICKC